jgi:hypothetical protein
MKASNDWFDKGFSELLYFLNDLLPKANMLPQNTYQAKNSFLSIRIGSGENPCMLK